MSRTLAVTAILLMIAAALPVYANGATPVQPAQPGAGPTTQPTQPAQPVQPPQPGVSMGACMMSSVAVDNNSVYVLAGNQLVKFNKSNMQQVSCVTLPAMSAQSMQTIASWPTADSMGATVGAGPATTTPSSICVVPNVTVDDNNVYVIRGNELMTLDKSNLQIRSTTTLASPAQPAMPGRGPEGVTLVTTQQGEQLLSQMADMTPTELERSYMQAIINSHADAIAWSQLATTKATRPEIRQFAQQVINEERDINQRWGTWMNSWYNVTLTPTTTASGQQTLDRLQNLAGTQFDIVYLQAMERHFSDAIALSQVASQRAEHAQLRQDASQMTQMHTQDLQQVQSWLQNVYNVQPGSTLR